jgi:hypothetical protein
VIVSGEEKRAFVRFPTDAECCDRSRKQKQIRRFLGRDKSQLEVPNSREADAELFEKIVKDKNGSEFDKSEAAAVVSRLERCKITNTERVGNTFRISMTVPRG